YPSGRDPSGKVKGKYQTVNRLTLGAWESHLRGEFIITPNPARGDGTCLWGAIDLDGKREGFIDLAALARRLADTPVIVTRSKSGDAHILCFLKEAVPP